MNEINKLLVTKFINEFVIKQSYKRTYQTNELTYVFETLSRVFDYYFDIHLNVNDLVSILEELQFKKIQKIPNGLKSNTLRKTCDKTGNVIEKAIIDEDGEIVSRQFIKNGVEMFSYDGNIYYNISPVNLKSLIRTLYNLPNHSSDKVVLTNNELVKKINKFINTNYKQNF